MHLTVSEAKARLTDLVRRAGAGEEVILIRYGHEVARLVPVQAPRDKGGRAALIGEVRARAGLKRTSGAAAARSQDFLYDSDGMPT